MQFGFFLKEALRGLRRNSAPALAALLTVLLTALVLGVFIPIVQATTGTANEVRNRVVVDVYVKDGATPAERRELQRALESTANVKSVEFISKEEGLAARAGEEPARLQGGRRAARREPAAGLVPRRARGPGQGGRDRRPRSTAAAAARRRSPRIDEVRNKEEDTDKILSATGLVKVLTAGLAALLVFASIALIANTIRLSIFARRREVEVMKLVGATNWFIRWPFVIEGVIVGFMGGVLAVLLLDDRQGDLHRPAVGPLRAAGGARTRSTSRC